MENPEIELKRIINEISKMESKFNDLRDKTKSKLDKAMTEADRKYIMAEFEKKVSNLKNDEAFVNKIKELKKKKKKLEEIVNNPKKNIPKQDNITNLQNKSKIVKKTKIIKEDSNIIDAQPTIFENLNNPPKNKEIVKNTENNIKKKEANSDTDENINSLINKYKNIKVDRFEINNMNIIPEKKQMNYFQESDSIFFKNEVKKPKKNINDLLKQINDDIKNFK